MSTTNVPLPGSIKEKAVSVLREYMGEETRLVVRQCIEDNPYSWWAPYHFKWGMAVRNFLRDKVCLDGDLPSNNWDDYYVQIVEEAVL